ncbi:hypothetical protein H257_14289 [Aphanomyces astaci]|uniref:Peptidase M14 domain-containing protein n=1 Tax=Aphanomyces astaci TaxID=112090 RepID=W4FTH8_APHAT|nr:hypothetical protein H257_14289 [Aphanomyces astaci]ETV70129.1 hypothetical protein H257_14289 [Aphanomyces astaci]|eukprot:XP_009840360.1 hypothetical protein H257_14289 [Aphanomyces astaci]
MKTIAILALASTAAAFAAGDTAASIQADANLNRKCHTTNDGYIPTLKAGTYTASKFHSCFRTSSNLRVQAISTTVQGKIIYAYKLTSGASKPRSLYYQSLLHALEWIAGSFNLFALSSILDDIANKKYTAADKFNLYFVPIANIDGQAVAAQE